MALSVSDVDWLAHNPTAVAAAGRRELSKASMIADGTYLRETFGEHARPLIELVQARRSAQGRIPEDWIFSADAAQQATHRAVAEHRARRILEIVGPERPIHDATCSIGSECAAFTDAGAHTVLGTDLDPARVAMAAHNIGPVVAVADALQPVSADAVLLADPARRAGGRRIVKPEDLLPPLPDLVQSWRGRDFAIKCAPGIDYSEWDGEVDIVSVDGGVKEACLYSPGLSRIGRSATLIASGSIAHYDDSLPDTCTVADAGRYIIDPDGAVVRAGLVRQYATAHGLWQLDERIAHLTGDTLPDGVSGFPVITQVPVKKVRQELAAMDCGSVEILVRGVDADPDALRKQWKLKGKRPLGVVITRIGSKGVAFICGPREG